MKCLFAVTVWGRDYIDEFVNITLPMHLASGNLGNLSDIESSSYIINTAAEDANYLKSLPQINALSNIINLEIETENILGGNKYQALGALQAKMFEKARSEEYEAVFPLYSDVLIAAGTFANCIKRLGDGHLAILSLGPQTVTEQMLPELLEPGRFWESPTALRVPPRQLVKLVFENLHPFHAPSFWKPTKFTNVPSMIFFEIPGQGVLAHGFHLHPVALKVQDTPLFSAPFYGSLDENYIPSLFAGADDVYIAPDSDELFMCSMDTILSGRKENAEGTPSIARVAAYAEGHAFMAHRDFLNFPMRMHVAGIDRNLWRPIEQMARGIIARINQRLAISDETLRLEDSTAYANRKYHRGILREMAIVRKQRLGLDDPNDVKTGRLLANLLARFFISTRTLILWTMMYLCFLFPYVLLKRIPELIIGLIFRLIKWLARLPYVFAKWLFRLPHVVIRYLPKTIRRLGKNTLKHVLKITGLRHLVKPRYFTSSFWRIYFLLPVKRPTIPLVVWYDELWTKYYLGTKNTISTILGITLAEGKKTPQKRRGVFRAFTNFLRTSYLDPALINYSTSEILKSILYRFFRKPGI